MNIKLKDLLEINPEVEISINFDIDNDLLSKIKKIDISKFGVISIFKKSENEDIMIISSSRKINLKGENNENIRIWNTKNKKSWYS